MTPTAELTHALVLAILAPDQERADRAIEIAEEIASRLTPKQIASAKRSAIKLTIRRRMCMFSSCNPKRFNA
jgi:hypothetical protein